MDYTIGERRKMHLSREGTQLSFLTLKGGEHELEYVTTRNYVEYINDSKSTNVNSTWYALTSMNKPIIWMAGGIISDVDFAPLTGVVKEKVRAIIGIGADNVKLHRAFGKFVDVIINAAGMDDAVSAARKVARYGDVILLSPCAASFDMFSDYRERGRKFKEAVLKT